MMTLQPTIAAILTLLVQTRAQFETESPDMSLLAGGGLRMAYPGIRVFPKLPTTQSCHFCQPLLSF